MNQYLEKLNEHLGNIQRAAEEEDDSYRSRILWNYLHHGALELGGDWERIFTPEMTIGEPRYEMRAGMEETVVIDGEEAVKDFYGAIEDENLMLIDDGNHQLFANDSGLAEFATTVEFVTGQDIIDDGVDKWYYRDPEIDDPDAPYVKTCRHAMYWPYTEEGRLIGEQVFQLEPFDVSNLDPDEVPTLDDVASVAENYYPENVSGPSPFKSVNV